MGEVSKEGAATALLAMAKMPPEDEAAALEAMADKAAPPRKPPPEGAKIVGLHTRRNALGCIATFIAGTVGLGTSWFTHKYILSEKAVQSAHPELMAAVAKSIQPIETTLLQYGEFERVEINFSETKLGTLPWSTSFGEAHSPQSSAPDNKTWLFRPKISGTTPIERTRFADITSGDSIFAALQKQVPEGSSLSLEFYHRNYDAGETPAAVIVITREKIRTFNYENPDLTTGFAAPAQAPSQAR